MLYRPAGFGIQLGIYFTTFVTEMELGQWVIYSWVTASDPLTHDDEITVQ